MTGQSPKILRTAEQVAAERKEAEREVARPARRGQTEIKRRRNRDLSRFGRAT